MLEKEEPIIIVVVESGRINPFNINICRGKYGTFVPFIHNPPLSFKCITKNNEKYPRIRITEFPSSNQKTYFEINRTAINEPKYVCGIADWKYSVI